MLKPISGIGYTLQRKPKNLSHRRSEAPRWATHLGVCARPSMLRDRPRPAILRTWDTSNKNRAMAKAYLVVRAEVLHEADRASFDHWYATDHLPLAIRTFAAQRGWRCWSRSEPAVHYAFYEFADASQAQALIGSEKIRPLIADFDRVWGDRVARRREILEVVQEM